jgi:hypothetical protein
MATDAKTTLALTALALIMPSTTPALEIREQPADVRRADVAHVAWTGAPTAEVSVEYRHGLDWVSVPGGVQRREDGGDASSATWRPDRQAPVGTYRMRVEGDGESLVSDEFSVSPCKCVIPGTVRWRSREGRFRVRVKAEYTRAGFGELSLPSAPVQTGRPLVRVLRDGHRLGSMRLRYERGAFRGSWPAPRHPQGSVVFRLVALRDGFGNR